MLCAIKRELEPWFVCAECKNVCVRAEPFMYKAAGPPAKDPAGRDLHLGVCQACATKMWGTKHGCQMTLPMIRVMDWNKDMPVNDATFKCTGCGTLELAWPNTDLDTHGLVCGACFAAEEMDYERYREARKYLK